MQKINFDKQTIIFSLLIVAVVIEVFILLPWGIKRLVSLSKKISLITQQIKTTQINWPRLGEYFEEKTKLEEQIEKSREKFILAHEASKSLSFISRASKEFGVEIKSFLPGELIDRLAEDGPEAFYLPIDIKARAKFHNLARFLDYLQNSQYFFDIKQLKIASNYPYNSVEITVWAIVEKK